MLKDISLSIIVPTLNNPLGVELLLDSLKQTHRPQDFEVLVVSNFYDDSTRAIVANYSFAKYLFSGKLGANAARNLGIQNAKNKVVYFFDDDCVLHDKYFFEKLINHIGQLNEDIFILGGRYLSFAKENSLDWAYHRIQDSWLQSGKINARNGNAFLLGGNCGGSKEIFLQQRFNEDFIYGGTETELFLRLYQSGYKIFYFPDLNIFHDTRLSIISFLKKAKAQARGHYRLETMGLYFTPIYQQPVECKNIYIFLYRLFFKLVYELQRSHGLLGQIKSMPVFFFRIFINFWQFLLSRIIALIDLAMMKK